jgi:hypothetical protein
MFLYTTNEPVVESSTNLTFGPYNFKYPHLKQHSELLQLVGVWKDDDGQIKTRENLWDQIYDVNQPKDGTKNTSLLEPMDFKVMTYKDVLPPEIEIEKTRDINYLFELPRQYGGQFVHEP